MKNNQIQNEYMGVITDFLQKIKENDDKYVTYLKCDIIDVPILQVGSIDVPILQVGSNMTRYTRTVEINDIVLRDV